MKKHLFFKILLFTIPLSAFVLMSNSGGKTGAYSGSPGDGNVTAPLDQKIELEMSQWEFEASWAWKY